ncbi:MAG: ATP-binding protein [Gemmatimonadota bacterium]
MSPIRVSASDLRAVESRRHRYAYPAAVGFAAAAILLRAALDPILGYELPLVTLFAGVAASVWFGGVGAGTLTALLGYAAVTYLFVEPRAAIRFSTAIDVVGFLAYAGSCALFLAFGHTMRAARSKSRARLDLLQTTLASIGDAVITTDAEGRVTFLNGHAEELTGWPTTSASGRALSEVFVIVNEVTGAPVEDPATRALREGEVVGLANHTVLIARDGTRRPIDDSAAPIRDDDGRVAGCILVFRDVSERRAAEGALREADRRKDEFLATLAHELRNPLSPIRNALGLMELAPRDEAVGLQARATMERQVRQMERLIDDLLDVSRITRNRLDLRLERVSLSRILEQVVDSQRTSAAEGDLQLTVQLPAEEIWIDGDAVRLSQIVGNLLSNAIKYTQPGGRVDLSARREERVAVISVRDNGAGIPTDMLDSVFDMFIQVDRRLERNVGGLGIGLTLVRQLVELHGGTVRAASDGPGRGSEFTVRLGLTDGADRPEPKPGKERPVAVPRRILVVDDNRDGAESLAMLLELSGHETRLAFDGEEALTAAADYRPEVILLDLGLPRVNGFDVCRRLRAEPWGKEMTIVALTGWGQDGDRRNSREAGFDGHLVKPVDHDSLLAAISNGQGRGERTGGGER